MRCHKIFQCVRCMIEGTKNIGGIGDELGGMGLFRGLNAHIM